MLYVEGKITSHRVSGSFDGELDQQFFYMTIHAFASGKIYISPLGWSSLFVCGYLFGFCGGPRVTTGITVRSVGLTGSSPWRRGSSPPFLMGITILNG